MVNVFVYFGSGCNYSDGSNYEAARSGVMYFYVQTDWHTNVRCSQQYHQDSVQWNIEFENIDEYFACGGGYDGSGWTGNYVTYGLGIFLQVVYYNEHAVRRGSMHIIYFIITIIKILEMKDYSSVVILLVVEV